MNRALPFLAGVVLVGGPACAVDEPAPSARRDPIVNGSPLAEGADPAVVYLDLGGGGCSGTLISPHVVLTALHCTSGASPSYMSACFGNRADGSCTWIDAVDKAEHPSVDIAMLALASPGPATPIPISDVPLTDGSVGMGVRIVGFGVTGEYSSDSGLKRGGSTTLHSYDTEVAYLGGGGSKTCYGDSGGPYFTTYGGTEVVFAVTSFGTSTCEAGLSGGMRVDPHVAWIRDFVAEKDPADCGADGLCATGCGDVDPDCPCAADGFCTDECPDFASADPDCAGCAGGDDCREDCPAVDPDCCVADGDCDAACGATLDPDCSPDDPDDPDDPSDPDDPDGDEPPAQDPNGVVIGGCAASGRARHGVGAAVLLALAIALARGRRRSRGSAR